LQGLKRLNWDIHLVSMLHCLTVVILSIPLFFEEELVKDKVFGYNYYAGNVYSVACGYFLWDALISLYHVKEFGVGFVLHGACCFGVFIFAYRPFLNYYGAVFLMYEISTPFLNIHWFMDKLGLTGTLPQLINGIFLLSSFFFARIIYGFYMSYHAYLSAQQVMSQIPIFLCIIYGISNMVLNILNVYWFFKMIESLMKRFDKGEKKHHKHHISQAGKSTSKSESKIKKN
ncbi:12275_t:CDS:2, partial [Acaulospora morrowiae]